MVLTCLIFFNVFAGENGEDAPFHVRTADLLSRLMDSEINQGIIGFPLFPYIDGAIESSDDQILFTRRTKSGKLVFVFGYTAIETRLNAYCEVERSDVCMVCFNMTDILNNYIKNCMKGVKEFFFTVYANTILFLK